MASLGTLFKVHYNKNFEKLKIPRKARLRWLRPVVIATAYREEEREPWEQAGGWNEDIRRSLIG